MNTAKTLDQLVELSSLVVPASLTGWLPSTDASGLSVRAQLGPVLTYDVRNARQSSAVVAACLDAASSCMRIKASPLRMANLADGFCGGSRRTMVALSAAGLPQLSSASQLEFFSDVLSARGTDPLFQTFPHMAHLFPDLSYTDEALCATLSVRGIDGLLPPKKQERKKKRRRKKKTKKKTKKKREDKKHKKNKNKNKNKKKRR